MQIMELVNHVPCIVKFVTLITIHQFVMIVMMGSLWIMNMVSVFHVNQVVNIVQPKIQKFVNNVMLDYMLMRMENVNSVLQNVRHVIKIKNVPFMLMER